jgi:hypothetical protein
MKGKNLPLAVLYRFGAHAEPFDHETAFCRAVAVGYDGPSRFRRPNDDWKRTDCGDVVIVESCDRIQPP